MMRSSARPPPDDSRQNKVAGPTLSAVGLRMDMTTREEIPSALDVETVVRSEFEVRLADGAMACVPTPCAETEK